MGQEDDKRGAKVLNHPMVSENSKRCKMQEQLVQVRGKRAGTNAAEDGTEGCEGPEPPPRVREFKAVQETNAASASQGQKGQH